MKDDQIKGYFAFDEKDLLANRNGLLSEKQSKRIRAADQFADRFIAGLLVVFLAGGILMGFLAFSKRSDIGLWIGTGVSFLLALWAFRGARTEVDDTVRKVQGKVEFVKVEKQSGAVTDSSSKRMKVSGYEMCVGGEAFANVNPALIEYMQGGVYTVYFSKTTRQILSVEEISTGKMPSAAAEESA